MANLTFATFPECCQRLLRELQKEGKEGARNCVKGHAVSLEYAKVIEAKAAKQPTAPEVPAKPAA
ncbi:MAG TPA: hypothetical protein VF947_00745 [Myxococcales bacterium]